MSRLERLLVLLDAGTTTATRRAAALQLGELQRAHPHELHSLLIKVYPYLRHKSWDTRVAAAQAIEAVASSVVQWNPQGGTVDTVRTTEALSFGSVQLSQVLLHGAPLLASGGKEFDAPDEGLDANARLTLQRTQLRQRLGLGAEADGLISDEDVAVTMVSADERSRRQREEEEAQRKAAEVRAVLASSEGLSARERNKARRKLKQGVDLKASTSLRTSTADLGGAMAGTSVGSAGIVGATGNALGEKAEDAQAFAQAETDEWPFSTVCERLRHELFDSQWEVRHGAALALRDVLRLHGRGAGTSAELSYSANVAANSAWLEDCAVRCVCVLALDRFADYVGDTAVAPVRETTAQALAALAKHLNVIALHQLVQALLELAAQPRWETRHGALQGLKYLVVVRGADVAALQAAIVAALQAGLSDSADDVRAVAAEALLPLVAKCAASTIAAMAMQLWDALSDLDELTAATASVLTLLAELHTLGAHVPAPLVELMPRLWPFFYHPVQSVRSAAFRMTQSLITSTSAPKSTSPSTPLSVAILEPALRHTFQTGRYESAAPLATHIQSLWRCLLSQIPSVELAAICTPLLSLWVEFAATPLTHTLTVGLLLLAHHHVCQSHHQQAQHTTSPASEPVASADGKKRGRATSVSDVAKKPRGIETTPHAASTAVPTCNAVALELVADEELRRASLLASLLGLLFAHLPASSFPSVLQPVFQLLNSMSARKRLLGALICHETAIATATALTSRDVIRVHLVPVLSQVLVIDDNLALAYTDVDASLTLLVSETRALAVASARLLSAAQLAPFTKPLEKPTAQARVQATRDLLASLSGVTPASVPAEAVAKRAVVQAALERTEAVAQATHVQVQAAAAAALSACGSLPEKINPVMRPLMSSLRLESLVALQRRSARALAEVLRQLEGRQPAPHAKVLANICALLCAPLSTLFTTTPLSEADAALAQVGQRGAEQALHECASAYGNALFTTLPSLWDTCATPLASETPDAKLCTEALLVLERLYCALHATALTMVRDKLLNRVVASLRSPSAPVRSAAGRCLAAACGADEAAAMEALVRHVLPMLGESSAHVRMGAGEALSQVVRQRGAAIAPYLAFLAVPLMRRMADPLPELRTSVAATFAAIVRLLPLEAGAPEPPSLPKDLAALRREERKFVEQLLDGAKLEAFVPCVKVKAELRAYQRDGVSWLAFLNRFGLHGVLCDDMGLGKTLQTITMITSDHATRRARFKETQHAEFAPLPTLVVCPPTLVPHWIYEIGKFAHDEFTATAYQGAPAERAAVRGNIGKYEVVVMSYDVLRKDVDVLASQAWNYAVLDEGHVIKNAKTKLAQAVKRIQAEHRLVLSGTPVQNNVLELWSLFDFLMPGFLGSEKEFNDAFSRPILASRDAKASARDIEAGTLALEALHRQVLPFLLRRRKEDVLHDLPPKIIQDQYADLSPLQLRLYETFAKTANVSAEIDAAEAEEGATNKASQHVFQALQYLRKLCSHPALVYDPAIPMHVAALKDAGGELHSIQHAPKLLALRQLLHESGIGTEDAAQPLTDAGAAHRVLLFAQMQSTLDLVENDLLKPLMPSVTYLRLDGNVEVNRRLKVVQQFNDDPTIDILLLTTHVGGLGLNLTGADTVIFLEHDWNPQRDLQAMDRAHRIGQKRVVNVYRLITRGTLEEKIMGLQRWKLNIAQAVVNADNASLRSMDTSQLVDLFSFSAPSTTAAPVSADAAAAAATSGLGVDPQAQSKKSKKSTGAKAVLENLEALWDAEAQYEGLNVESFMKSM